MNYFLNLKDDPNEIDPDVIKYSYSDYMNAIKHSKIRLKVDKGYQPFLIMKGLFKSKECENYIEVLNIINSQKHMPLFAKINSDGSSKPQDIFQRQMHFDFLLHTIPQTTKKIKKSTK